MTSALRRRENRLEKTQTLITGGTGLIGARIADRLLDMGSQVLLLDLNPDQERVNQLESRHGAARVSVVAADIRDRAAIEQAVRDEPVSAIVHLASVLGSACQREPQLATQVNILGTLNVFELARELGVARVVCASSITVFGADSVYPPADLPLGDDAAQYVAEGVRVYGASKVYIEALAAAYRASGGPLVVGLRPSIVYGAAQRNASVDWVHSAVTGAVSGGPVVIANGGSELSLVHVDDVTDQFVALAAAPAEVFGDGAFFNTGGDHCSIAEFARILQSVCPDAQITAQASDPGPVFGIATEVDGSGIDAIMGRPRRYAPLSEGLAKYVADVRRDGATG